MRRRWKIQHRARLIEAATIASIGDAFFPWCGTTIAALERRGNVPKPKKTEKVVFSIPQIRLDRMKLKLIGTSPLIMHKWSAKAKRQMLEGMLTGMKAKKTKKDPKAEYEASVYRLGKGYGLPAIAFKKAAVGACRYVEGLPMTQARTLFHVIGEMNGGGEELVRIVGKPRQREDIVRLPNGAPDVRYRAEFPEWKAELLIEFDPSLISPQQIASLMNLAGFHGGVGEMRPEKTGFNYGRFHVAA